MKLPMIFFGSLFILSGCAHHNDVRPGADGVHKVVVKNEDTEQGSRDAISQANHFCEKRNKNAAFVNEKQKYSGPLDESTYKNAKMATSVAKTVGAAVFALGGKKESNAGGVVGLGGVAGDAALGKGYTVEMRFKCI